jgi:hypothetical protein
MCVDFKPIVFGIGIGNLAIWPLWAIDCQCRLSERGCPVWRSDRHKYDHRTLVKMTGMERADRQSGHPLLANSVEKLCLNFETGA